MIGSIRATLRKAGVLDRTVVVFTSDNGLHMGEHGLNPGKQTAFDTDINVPLIAAGLFIKSLKTIQTIDAGLAVNEWRSHPLRLAITYRR